MSCNRDEADSWILRQLQRAETNEGLSFAITQTADDAALGYVGLLFRPKLESGIVGVCREDALSDPPGVVFQRQPGNVGIGYWMIERARGEGRASRAVALVSHWALTDGGLIRIEALTDPAHVASQRVVERAGFKREGCLRSYLIINGQRTDAIIYSLLADDL
jgi:RimJ/RimL family protein N-acetyltransferase